MKKCLTLFLKRRKNIIHDRYLANTQEMSIYTTKLFIKGRWHDHVYLLFYFTMSYQDFYPSEDLHPLAAGAHAHFFCLSLCTWATCNLAFQSYSFENVALCYRQKKYLWRMFFIPLYPMCRWSTFSLKYISVVMTSWDGRVGPAKHPLFPL